MKQYKFTNEDRSHEVMIMLKRVFDQDEFKILKTLDGSPRFINKLLSKTNYYKQLKIYRKSIKIIIEFNIDKDPNTVLNHFLSDDYLSFDEAMMLIIGLSPLTIDAFESDLKIANKKIKSVLLKRFLEMTTEGRGLTKAPRIGEESGFISDEDDKVYTKGLISWTIEKGFIEEVIENEDNQIAKTEKLVSGVYERDPETQIPLHRLKIYKETLPGYLESLKQPIAVRALTMPNDAKDGEYTILIESRLGVGGSTTKREIPDLINKSSWWKSQPQSIRNKIKKQ